MLCVLPADVYVYPGSGATCDTALSNKSNVPASQTPADGDTAILKTEAGAVPTVADGMQNGHTQVRPLHEELVENGVENRSLPFCCGVTSGNECLSNGTLPLKAKGCFLLHVGLCGDGRVEVEAAGAPSLSCHHGCVTSTTSVGCSSAYWYLMSAVCSCMLHRLRRTQTMSSPTSLYLMPHHLMGRGSLMWAYQDLASTPCCGGEPGGIRYCQQWSTSSQT